MHHLQRSPRKRSRSAYIEVHARVPQVKEFNGHVKHEMSMWPNAKTKCAQSHFCISYFDPNVETAMKKVIYVACCGQHLRFLFWPDCPYPTFCCVSHGVQQLVSFVFKTHVIPLGGICFVCYLWCSFIVFRLMEYTTHAR